MSDKNRQSQLRLGLTQYVGAMLANSDFKGKAAAQLTAAATTLGTPDGAPYPTK